MEEEAQPDIFWLLCSAERPRRQNGDSLFFLLFLVEHWPLQHGGAAIDQACGFSAEGNNVAGFQITAKSFTSTPGSHNTKMLHLFSFS